MLIGLCAVAICFPICLVMWSIEVFDIVPWKVQQTHVEGLFICVASLYLPIFPCVFAGVCHRKLICSNPTVRVIAALLLGLSLGLFMSAGQAIFGKKLELEPFQTESFQKLLCGPAPASLLEPARTLFERAELLAMTKAFFECWVIYTLGVGVIALLTILLYDRATSWLQARSQV